MQKDSEATTGDQASKDKKELFFLYGDQVSGKSPKLLTENQERLLKAYDANQNSFYLAMQGYHVSDPMSALSHYLPKYFGCTTLAEQPAATLTKEAQDKSTQIWLKHLAARYAKRVDDHQFMKLENLTKGWKAPNVLDIKVGGRNQEGKKHKITKAVSKYFIRLNGCRMNFVSEGEESVFLSKYYLKGAVEMDKIVEYMALFFYNGQEILLDTVRSVRDQVADLILRFKGLKGYKFTSSSLCIFYDAHSPERVRVAFLDFGRVKEQMPFQSDDETCTGFINIHKVLSAVLEKSGELLMRCEEMRVHYRTAEVTVIPDKKKEAGSQGVVLRSKQDLEDD